MTARTNVCKNCKYYAAEDGTCRRRAPVVTERPRLVGDDNHQVPVPVMAGAPKVTPDYWCGEHKKKS